jgi:hypothetical protein
MPWKAWSCLDRVDGQSLLARSCCLVDRRAQQLHDGLTEFEEEKKKKGQPG